MTTPVVPASARPADALQSGWAALATALLALAVFVAYSGTFHAPFVMDDRPCIVTNLTLRSAATWLFPPSGSGMTVSGRPILNLSLAIDYTLWGADVRAYHATNLAIHILATLTLFGIVRRTAVQCSKLQVQSSATSIAFFTALIWALHPLQTESVTYTIQRAESLAGLFTLLTIYCFSRCAADSSNLHWSAASVVCCALGMATKETVAAAPILVLLYDGIFVSGSFREAWNRRRKFYLALAGTWLLLGALVAASAGRGESVAFASAVPWWRYALTQSVALVRYLRLAFWPSGQIFDYGIYVVTSPPVIAACSVFVALLLAGTMLAIKRRSALGFLGAWFFLILAPSSSVVPVVTQTVAEHRVYLPLAAVVSLVVVGLHRATRGHGWIFLLPGAMGLSAATFQRNHIYRSALSLWDDTVRKNPKNYRAQNNLGLAYVEDGQTDKAIACFNASLQLMPTYFGQTNLGNALLNSGRVTEAVSALRKAVELDPNSAQAHAMLAHALTQAGQSAEAIAELERAVTLDPQNSIAQHNLATALVRAGRHDEAAGRFEIVLKNDPNDFDARNDYGLLLGRTGRLAEAIKQFEAALQANPDFAEAHNNLGLTLAMSGRDEEALVHFAEAIRLNPKSPDAHYNYAKALMRREKWADAIEQYRALLTLVRPTAEICNSLGAACANLGRMDEAASWFHEALQLDPQNVAARENLSRLEASRGSGQP